MGPSTVESVVNDMIKVKRRQEFFGSGSQMTRNDTDWPADVKVNVSPSSLQDRKFRNIPSQKAHTRVPIVPAATSPFGHRSTGLATRDLTTNDRVSVGGGECGDGQGQRVLLANPSSKRAKPGVLVVESVDSIGLMEAEIRVDNASPRCQGDEEEY
jgi:hypothetical protein